MGFFFVWLSVKLKAKLDRKAVRPALLYRSECWAVKNSQQQRIQETEMRLLCYLIGGSSERIGLEMSGADIRASVRLADGVARDMLEQRVESRQDRCRPQKDVGAHNTECGIDGTVVADRRV